MIHLEDQNRFVKLQIWDTAGQERFRGLAKNYYRGADAVILVYDVTVARSFVDLPGWLEELKNFSLDERDILQLVVANKVTLCHPKPLFHSFKSMRILSGRFICKETGYNHVRSSIGRQVQIGLH